MIAFKDFLPRQLRAPGFLSDAQHETFEAAVAAANEWIAARSVRVINVETVVLPNLWGPDEEGTGDAAVRTAAEDYSSTWHQFLRVWYDPQPGP